LTFLVRLSTGNGRSNVAADDYVSCDPEVRDVPCVNFWTEWGEFSYDGLVSFYMLIFLYHSLLYGKIVKPAVVLVRTPPPPVRRHHQIAASGRDP
jgi:hypothetical protein